MSKHKIYKEGADTSYSPDIRHLLDRISSSPASEHVAMSGLCHPDAILSLSPVATLRYLLLVSANFQTQAWGKCQSQVDTLSQLNLNIKIRKLETG